VQRPETKARARALQLLYAWELSGRPSIATLVARLAGGFGRVPEGFDRGADLAAKAIAGLPEFDRRVADAAEHWRLDRVGVEKKRAFCAWRSRSWPRGRRRRASSSTRR